MNRFFKQAFGILTLTASGFYAAAATPTIYGLVASSEELATGIYSFEPTEDLNMTAVQLSDEKHNFSASSGAVYNDGKYVTTDFSGYRIFDTDSWTLLKSKSLSFPQNMNFSAKSVASDPTTGKVYGCFMTAYTADHPFNSYAFATVDYDEKTISMIRDFGNADKWIDDLFVTKSGEIYGVLNSGMLVRIDKENGEFTEIGDTGMKPYGYHGGAVDPATGTAYWALSTEETTGLYELDLTDGAVVLIAEFPGKSQLTGLFIVAETTPEPTPNPPADNSVIYGLVSDSSANYPSGIYSFEPSDEIVLNPIQLADDKHNFSPMSGAVYNDGKYVTADFSGYRIFDADSWALLKSKSLSFPMNMEFAAKSLASDPNTGKVYGCFMTVYSAEHPYNSFRFATVDYEERTISEIRDLGTENDWIDDLFITPAGEIYGVLNNGMLVRIDKETGEFTEIGDTGMKPYGNHGGVVDPATGTAYWALSTEETTGLYELDLTDGSVVLICEFPDKVQLTGLYMLSNVVTDDEVPAVAKDLTLNFTDYSLEGSLTFTAPELSEGGNELKNDLNYVLTMNDEEAVSGTVAPGATITTDSFILPASGSYLAALTISNNAGNSKVAYTRQYIGYAEPEAATGVTLAFEGNKANVSWTAPTKAATDGYFANADIAYMVIRYPEAVTVCENLKNNTFSEEISSDVLTPYSYGVIAFNGDAAGKEATSNIVNHGSSVSLPYFEDFDDRAGFELYTIIDANGDGNNWGINEYSHSIQYYSGTSSFNADDWVVLPAIKFEKSKIYSFSLLGNGNSTLFTQDIDVAMGTEPTVKALNKVIIPTASLTETPETITALFTVEKDGIYYIGIHTNVPTGTGMLEINEIGVKAVASVEGPAEVSGLTVTPGEKGELKSKVSFTTPDKTYEGKALSQLTKVELTRDNEIIKTWESPAKGAKLDFEDTGLENGMHTYSVVAYSDKGAGYPAIENVWVGIDVPSPVKDITLEEKNGKAYLAWSSSSEGAHGGYVDTAALVYSIQRADGEMAAVGIDQTTFTEEVPEVDYQYDLAYAIVAFNEVGNSIVAVSPRLVLGPDYELPFEESFRGAATQKYWSVIGSAAGYFALNDGFAYDNDGGSVVYQSGTDYAEGEIISGRIDFSHAEYPGIELFAALSYGAAAFEIHVIKENGERSLAAGYELDRTGVIYHIVAPLEQAKGEKGVRIALKAISDAETALFVDAISIRDDKELVNVTEIASGDIKVSTVPGAIVVNGAEGLDITVSALDGKIVSSFVGEADNRITVAAGIYVVKAGNKSFKVIVK